MTDAQAGGILQLFLYTNNVDAAIICAWKPEVKAQYVARQAKAQEEAKRKRARLEEPAEPVELVA